MILKNIIFFSFLDSENFILNVFFFFEILKNINVFMYIKYKPRPVDPREGHFRTVSAK